jgi:hypothetical protein
MDKFEKYKCAVYYPDVMTAANQFRAKHCNTPPSSSVPTCDQNKCEKVKKLVPVVVGGHIIYKAIEIWFCPPLAVVTP